MSNCSYIAATTHIVNITSYNTLHCYVKGKIQECEKFKRYEDAALCIPALRDTRTPPNLIYSRAEFAAAARRVSFGYSNYAERHKTQQMQ